MFVEPAVPWLSATALTANHRAGGPQAFRVSCLDTRQSLSGPEQRNRGIPPQWRDDSGPLSRPGVEPRRISAASVQHLRSLGKYRADFVASTSIRTSHWVLQVVLLSKLRLCCKNCSWWFPQGSTSEPCKLLNLLVPK